MERILFVVFSHENECQGISLFLPDISSTLPFVTAVSTYARAENSLHCIQAIETERNGAGRGQPGVAGEAGMSEDPGRGCHDIGGLPAGRVERAEHAHALWEKRVDALMVLLSNRERRVITVDELRRGIEQLGAEAYDAMSYYERWVAAITSTLLGKGVITADELGRRMAEVEARGDGGG